MFNPLNIPKATVYLIIGIVISWVLVKVGIGLLDNALWISAFDDAKVWIRLFIYLLVMLLTIVIPIATVFEEPEGETVI